MTESVVWVAGVGAVAGLGAALARRFAREGYRVAVSGRSLDKLQTVVAQIEASGGKANAVVADSGVEADVLAAIAQVNQLGTLKRTGWADRSTGMLVVDDGTGQIKIGSTKSFKLNSVSWNRSRKVWLRRRRRGRTEGNWLGIMVPEGQVHKTNGKTVEP